MALGAGGWRFFGLILFIELFVACTAIIMNGFCMVFKLHFLSLRFFYFLFPPFFFELLWHFARYFMALDAFLNIIAVFQLR